MKPAKWDTMQWDYFRWDVIDLTFENVMRQFKAVAVRDATRRKLSLGARDSTTGHRAKSFTESTVTGLFATKGHTFSALPPGLFVRYDAAFRTQDGFVEGDEFQHTGGDYYEVKAVEEHWQGDSFMFRDVHLTKMPLHT